MAIQRRGRLRKSLTNPSKYKVVIIVGDDSEEDIVKTVDVSIPTIENQPIPSPNEMTLPLKVTKENGDKKFVFSDLTFSDNAVNFSYPVTSVMKDVNNKQVGEPLTVTLQVEDSRDARVRNVTIREVKPEQFRLRLVVVGDHEDNIVSAEVIFSDYSGPEPIPTELLLTDPIIKDSKKIFKDNTLNFDDPSAAADQIYYLVVDLKDAEGNSLGSTEYTVVVEGLEVEA